MLFKRAKQEEQCDEKYQTLSATDKSSTQAYYSALDFALSNDSVQNIGVIGAHASGKTSVLRSYNRHCKEDRVAKKRKLSIFEEDYVYITLGDYVRHMSESDDGQQSLGHQSTTSDLQYRIIEQLLCYNPPSRAKYSTIPLLEKTFKNTSSLIRFLKCVLATLVVFTILIGLNFFGTADTLQSAIGMIAEHPTSTLEVTSRENSATTTADGQTTRTFIVKTEPITHSNDEKLAGCLRLACVAIMSFVAAWQILRLYNAGITIKGMTIGGNSFNMENKALPFDTQIDNLLYLLRSTGSHVMVFEDVDRVDDRYEILTNLRELCFELNVVERTSKKGPLSRRKIKPYKFIYCLEQEGIPSTEERTKFFDFIVEMVPYGDYTNFGGLLDSILRNTYHIDRVLLDRAGRAMNNTRECEHVVNEFILRQKVLAESNHFTATHRVPPSFNNKVFALVAYKSMYPADYTRLSRSEGFLFEALQSHSKEDALEGVSNNIDVDKTRPYVALAKAYGKSKNWTDSFLDMLECLPHAPTGRHVLSFVKFALEQGYISERYEPYTSLWRGEMAESDRKFCLYADAHVIDENEKDSWWSMIVKDPIGVLNWLGHWSVAENECALNYSLLDHLLNANVDGKLDTEEKRTLIALLESTACEEKIRFYESYLIRCSARQLYRLFLCINSSTPELPVHNLGRLEYVASRSSNDDTNALMLFSYLRAVSVAEATTAIDDIVPDRNKLVESIERTPDLLQASFESWWENPDNGAYDGNTDDEFVSKDIAREIAEGLSRLSVRLKSLAHSHENRHLVTAIVERNCYEITSETVDSMLGTLLTAEERLQFRDTSILSPLIHIAEGNTNCAAAVKERMKVDLESFIEVAIANAETRVRRYKDSPDTLYLILDEKNGISVDLLSSLLLAQEERRLTYSSINNRAMRSDALRFCEPTLDNLEAYSREHSGKLDDKSLDFIYRIAGLRGSVFSPRDESQPHKHVTPTDEQRAYLTPIIEQAVQEMRAKGESEILVTKVQGLLY